MNAVVAGAPSKRAKIWKRTWVGLTIASALLCVLWVASVLDSAMPVLGVAMAVLAVSIFEVARMGSLRELRLGWPLGIAGALVGVSTFVALEDASYVTHGDVRYSVLWLAEVTVLTAATITLVHAFVHSRSWGIRGAVFVAATVLALSMFARIEGAVFIGVVAILFVFVRTVLIGAERARETLAVILLGTLLVVSIPGLAWVWLGFEHMGLVALLAICKLGDTAGYYVGSAIGKHRPFPNISPGKSSEGCFGSLVASSAAGAAAVAIGWLPEGNWGLLGGAFGGALVNVAAQASDLLESWVKRRAGVKDSSTWFGPSGGMLDLVDSFFIATPLALLIWPIVFFPID